MNRLMRLLFERRGLAPTDLAILDMPTCTRVEGEQAVVDRLAALRAAGSKVVVMPDFDMDGIMSGVLGYAGLSELGFDAELYIPHPERGYGLNPVDVDDVHDLWPGAAAILTCDVGIGCKAAAARALELGLEFIVTDHHEESSSSSPEGLASAIACPRRVGEGKRRDEAKVPNVCGAEVLHGVLMRFAEQHCGPDKVDAIDRLRVLAGIGTVSDLMPLKHDNRDLVRDAVALLRVCWMGGDSVFANSIKGHPAYVRVFQGLHAACQAFADAGKLRDVDDIDEGFIGYYLAPAFNSCKRMDGDLSRAFGVFLGFDPSGDMAYLVELNEQRKEAVAAGYERMMAATQPLAPFVYVSDARPGVLGLLATRARNETGLPCVVMRREDDGSMHGSGRSPEWFPFVDWSADKPWRAAGHNPAFGASVANAGQAAQLAAELEVACKPIIEQHRRMAEAGELPEPFDIHVSTLGGGDVGVDLALFADFVSEVNRLKPFGKGFPEPAVRLTFDASEAVVTTMGSEKQHLRIVLPGGLVAISWNAAARAGELGEGGIFEMDGKLSVNEFMDKHSVQFIGDIRPRNRVVDLGTIEIGVR